MNLLIPDLRFAVRQIRRHPGFALIAALSLAVGVGATSAVFNAARVAIFQPVPGAGAPDRLVEVVQTNLTGTDSSNLSYQDFLDLRDQVDGLEAVAAFEFSVFSFTLGSEGERIPGMHVTPDYFEVMGLNPAQGRFIAPDEDGPAESAPVAVLGYQFWQERLGGSPDVIGSTVWINRVPLTVIGVMPEEFTGHLIAFRSDIYLPLHAHVSIGGISPQLLTDRNAPPHSGEPGPVPRPLGSRFRPGSHAGHGTPLRPPSRSPGHPNGSFIRDEGRRDLLHRRGSPPKDIRVWSDWIVGSPPRVRTLAWRTPEEVFNEGVASTA